MLHYTSVHPNGPRWPEQKLRTTASLIGNGSSHGVKDDTGTNLNLSQEVCTTMRSMTLINVLTSKSLNHELRRVAREQVIKLISKCTPGTKTTWLYRYKATKLLHRQQQNHLDTQQLQRLSRIIWNLDTDRLTNSDTQGGYLAYWSTVPDTQPLVHKYPSPGDRSIDKEPTRNHPTYHCRSSNNTGCTKDTDFQPWSTCHKTLNL